tara:strand:- start:382 stop:927 length:546 start_codon:yes stop_codon:yes gene_type:complete
MAFKMRPPGKMKSAFRKSTIIKKFGSKKNLGRIDTDVDADAESTFYYNSNMGPMKLLNPSALKQMEEEMAAGDMEEMMGEGMEGGDSSEEPTTEKIITSAETGALIHSEDFIGNRLHISSDEGDMSKNTAGDAVAPAGLELDTEYKIEYADDFVEGNTGMYEWELDTETNTITLLSEITEE